MIREYFRLALNAITRRKVRSWLTVMGIVIGIASIVALISVSDGLENAITEQFEKMGSRRIFLFPKGAFDSGNIAGEFTQDQIEFIERRGEFDEVVAWKMVQNAKLEYKGEVINNFLSGVPEDKFEDYMESFDYTTEKGRMLQKGDKFDVVIGYKFASDAFKEEIIVGNSIDVNGQKFRVVGILAEIGNSDDDNQIYIPNSVVNDVLGREVGYFYVDMTVKEGLDMNLVIDDFQHDFEKKKGDDYFEVNSPEDVLQSFNDVLGIVKIVLGGIAAISLLVGGIGIMNSMFTNVLERKREIGIMKSIGARNSNIMLLFLWEAMIIGFIGGLGGVMLGLLIAKGIQAAAWAAGFKMLLIKVNPVIVASGILFAMVVGGISGVLPARGAAKLKVVDALRN